MGVENFIKDVETAEKLLDTLDAAADFLQKIEKVDLIRVKPGDVLLFHVNVKGVPPSEMNQFMQSVLRAIRSVFTPRDVEVMVIPFRDEVTNKVEIVRKEDLENVDGQRDKD